MLLAPRAFLVVAAAAATVLSAPTSHAHIDLLEPEPRAHGTAARGDTDIDVNSNLKQGPCGQVATGRTDRVTTYTAGQTITVRVREENVHVSYLRVSVDLDGDDFPLRSGPVAGPETQEVAAAAEAALGNEGLLAVYREDNDTAGFVHQIVVTLPRQSCTNCTLQVIQYMYDDPAAPYYFQCADLVIVDAPVAAAAPDATDAGVVGNGEAAGDSGTSGLNEPTVASPAVSSPDDSASMSTASTPPTAAGESGVAPGTTSVMERSEVSSDSGSGGGCGVARRAPGALSSAGFGLWLVALAYAQRRRGRGLEAAGAGAQASGAFGTQRVMRR
jgi:hypothetical protein